MSLQFLTPKLLSRAPIFRISSNGTTSRFVSTSRNKSNAAAYSANFASSSSTKVTSRRAGDGNATIVYGVIGGLAMTVLGGMKYMHDHVGGTEGLVRTASFYSLAIPKYIEYRMHMWRDSPDEVWDDLHRDTSQNGLEKILELRGFYIKSGQMCAANIGNAFPKIWQDTMSVLEDDCPCKDFATVKAVIESEYGGKPINEIFSTFDKEPIGAASIGQVHRATLRDGSAVVVKVMYPEVERLFRGDVRTIKMFAQVAQPVHVPALEEVEKQFMTEFDYKKESEQLATVRKNLMKAGLAGDSTKLCAVPKPYPNLCTKRVLVMEELKGEKLAVALRKDTERHAHRAGKTLDQFKTEEEEKERVAKEAGIAKRGPSAQEYSAYINLLDGKRKLKNAGALLHNCALGWVPGASWKSYESRASLPINHAKMIDDLLYIHGHEVLVDGYFQGDPHPGNILLLGIEEGRPQLGLIDYGQVKKLPKDKRLLMCRMIIALADEKREDIIRLMKEAGYKSQRMDEANIYKYAKVSYDEDNDELTEGKHIQVFVEDLQRVDPIEQLPKDWIMVGRTSIMLRGLAHALHQSRSVAKAWRPIAEKVLQEEGMLD